MLFLYLATYIRLQHNEGRRCWGVDAKYSFYRLITGRSWKESGGAPNRCSFLIASKKVKNHVF